MKFDLKELVDYVRKCNPKQVNIGVNSKEHIVSFRDREPSKEEVLELINELERFTKVVQKSNLNRL